MTMCATGKHYFMQAAVQLRSHLHNTRATAASSSTIHNFPLTITETVSEEVLLRTLLLLQPIVNTSTTNQLEAAKSAESDKGVQL
jgi:hypothetical protein